TRIAPQRPEAEAQVPQGGLDQGESPLVAVGLLDLIDAAEFAQRLAAGLPGTPTPAQVLLDGPLEVRSHFRVQVVLEPTPPEERHDTAENHAARLEHRFFNPSSGRDRSRPTCDSSCALPRRAACGPRGSASRTWPCGCSRRRPTAPRSSRAARGA